MMKGYMERFQLTAALFGVAVILLVGISGSNSLVPASAAQKAQKDDDSTKPGKDTVIELVGASVCMKCHQEKNPSGVKEYRETQGFTFVRLSENIVWSSHDLHSTAFKNLLTEQAIKAKKDDPDAKKDLPNHTAQRMENNLQQSKGDKGYLVSKDVNCLACHASTQQPIDKAPPKTWTPDKFYTDDGVGCEMCHGHGSAYRDKHQVNKLDSAKAPPGATRVVPWREWDPATKAEWGLVDLRDPAVATQRCASCHIGNKDEGRFVTHDMYAAGHPPLPPLDLIAYNREQPRHWGLPTEMPFLTDLAKRDPAKAYNIFHFKGGESYIARRFVDSTMATLHSAAISMKQLATTAKSDGGLDFAAFDCYACHHDLKYPSERQNRGYIGKPGRPLFRPAPFALVKVVLEHAAEMQSGTEDWKKEIVALNEAEKHLTDAFANKSLGDPDEIVKATNEISAWSMATLAKLNKLKYDAGETRRLLAKVVEATKQPIADPEVAQIYSWAAETFVLDISGKPMDKDPKPPAILTQFHDQLKGIVVTRLRPGAAFYYEQGIEGGVPGPTLEPVDGRIQARMKVLNNFKADEFRKAFLTLEPLLPKGK
jgi:hypothetical protein